MSYTEIWIHLVWLTKFRYPYLKPELRKNLIRHIRRNAKRQGIYIHSINGHTDHLHALISLQREQSIARVVQLLKGESANWINKNHLTRKNFKWQEKYYAVSISPSGVDHVCDYINNDTTQHLDEATMTQIFIAGITKHQGTSNVLH